jgi:GT2 family glycosyltransferase
MAHHVAIVVLTLNGREDTLACLASLAEVRWRGRLTTIVVDNGSTDGTSDAVREQFADVVLVRSEDNLGFTGGNNLGIRRALELGADDVMLLNNDTEVEAGMVEALEDALAELPDAGALCPLILYAEPPDLIWYAGARFDPRRGYHGRLEGYGERDRGQYVQTRETDVASGCAMLVPRGVLEEVGGFADDLFLHYEDVDLSLRIRETGRRVYVTGRARVFHKISAGTGGEHSPTIAYYGMRNCLEVCRRHAGMGRARFTLVEVEAVAAHLMHVRRARHPARNLQAAWAGWRDFHRGRLGRRGAAEVGAS